MLNWRVNLNWKGRAGLRSVSGILMQKPNEKGAKCVSFCFKSDSAQVKRSFKVCNFP